MIYLPADHEPINRADIMSRHAPRDDARRPERIVITPLDIDWTLVPDKRDVRRWRALDAAEGARKRQEEREARAATRASTGP